MAYRTQIRIGVKAPPAAVWAAMSDLDQWADWNPYYVEAAGKLQIGAQLEFARMLGGVREAMTATLVDWVPGEQLVWKRNVGLFNRTIAYIEIEGLTGEACILTVGEIFDGLVGQHVSRRRRRLLKAGMQALGDALKARAEARWDGVPDLSVVPAAPPPHAQHKGPAKPMQMSMFGRRGPR